MRFLMIFLLSVSFIGKAFAEEYDIRNRQACIDELKHESDKVCQGVDEATLASLLKNGGFMAETNSRIQRICTYHCPRDIAQKCIAYLGRGQTLLTEILSGKKSLMNEYKDGCQKINAKIEEEKKNIAAMGGGANNYGNSDKGAALKDNGLATGNFRKPTATPAPKGKCNPYNAAGQLEVGKCDD